MEANYDGLSNVETDLRIHKRNQVDLLRGRIELLEGKDRAMMEMYLEQGNSLRQIAELLGVNATSLARRIRKLSERLTKGIYLQCRRHENMFSESELSLAKDYFLRGMNMRRIAKRRKMRYHKVREKIRCIEYLCGKME
jgi:predicted DNA-binding protein YlxM (UPF0122 family)